MKPRLPLERHKEIGAELQAMHNKLFALVGELSTAHPFGSRVVRRAERALDTLDSLRSALDSIACATPSGNPSVYYPDTYPPSATTT